MIISFIMVTFTFLIILVTMLSSSRTLENRILYCGIAAGIYGAFLIFCIVQYVREIRQKTFEREKSKVQYENQSREITKLIRDKGELTKSTSHSVISSKKSSIFEPITKEEAQALRLNVELALSPKQLLPIVVPPIDKIKSVPNLDRKNVTVRANFNTSRRSSNVAAAIVEGPESSSFSGLSTSIESLNDQ